MSTRRTDHGTIVIVLSLTIVVRLIYPDFGGLTYLFLSSIVNNLWTMDGPCVKKFSDLVKLRLQ